MRIAQISADYLRITVFFAVSAITAVLVTMAGTWPGPSTAVVSSMKGIQSVLVSFKDHWIPLAAFGPSLARMIMYCQEASPWDSI